MSPTVQVGQARADERHGVSGDLKYTKDHEWIELAGDSGEVGITDYAQQQLGDVVYVELPEIGAKLKAGQSFGTIESVKAVSELYSPVTGEVVEVNNALKDKPETVNKDPHGSWMIVDQARRRRARPARCSTPTQYAGSRQMTFSRPLTRASRLRHGL